MTGVTFLGVKFNYPVDERVRCAFRVDGCLFPACDKEVKKHRKASIMQSENGPCGWLHGLHFHLLAFTTALLPQTFILFLCSHSLSFSPPCPHCTPLSCSQKRASSMWLEGWSGFFSTPVDSTHVGNIHKMSVNQSINHRHLMKA